MPTTLYDRLARLLAYYENSADTVRAQLRVLGRGQDDRAPARGLKATVHDSSAHQASSHEADRRSARRANRGLSHSVIERRAQTAAVLAQFDSHEPKHPRDLRLTSPGLGSLVRRGYLRHATGGGYVRTEKPFVVHPRSKH